MQGTWLTFVEALASYRQNHISAIESARSIIYSHIMLYSDIDVDIVQPIVSCIQQASSHTAMPGGLVGRASACVSAILGSTFDNGLLMPRPMIYQRAR